MELAKLQGYVRVERSTFRDEHFYSTQNFLYVIEKGVFAYTVNGKTYQARELDCVYFKKSTYYERTVVSPVILHIFELAQPLADADAPISIANSQRIRENIAFLDNLQGTVKENLPYIEHLLNDILHTHRQEKQQVPDPLETADSRITQALSIIHDNFHRELSVNALAEAVHLSYPQFNRLFVKYLGVTPIRYIHQLRLEKAKGLLYTTELPIKVIADECGFKDIYYFSNFFRAATGCSPTQYRNKPGSS